MEFLAIAGLILEFSRVSYCNNGIHFESSSFKLVSWCFCLGWPVVWCFVICTLSFISVNISSCNPTFSSILVFCCYSYWCTDIYIYHKDLPINQIWILDILIFNIVVWTMYEKEEHPPWWMIQTLSHYGSISKPKAGVPILNLISWQLESNPILNND